MKGLLVSDLHYALKQFDWLCSVADDFDLVVLAGDHLDISSCVQADVQIVVVLKYLRTLSAKTQVVVSSGNHDLTGQSEAGEKVAKWMSRVRRLGIPTDGDSLETDGMLVTICPWWDGPQSRDAVGVQLARDAERAKDRWIWVYHAPPADSPVSWIGSRYIGDTDLSGWIAQYEPQVVLTGHIHQAPFRKGGSWVDRIGSTWVFNAGRQIGPCPTHIIFDTEEGRATWYSLAGSQFVELNGAFYGPVGELSL